jgi:hypothetical protein
MTTNPFMSKKFWTAIVGILTMLAVAAFPGLEEHIETLAPSILGIVMFTIGGFTVQDTAIEKYSNGTSATT